MAIIAALSVQYAKGGRCRRQPFRMAMAWASARKRLFALTQPERPIFLAGLEVLGLPEGAKVAMIGDRLDTDVGGAQAAGLDGILVTGNDSIPPGTETTPDHEIESLAGLIL